MYERENMTDKVIFNSKSTASTMGWGAVLIWFSANILSQAIFIGTHGVPYDASAIIVTLGPWSWVLVAIELTIWVIIGMIVLQKIKSARGIKNVPPC